MLIKAGGWNWRDFYRLPLAAFMTPFVAYNNDMRQRGLAPGGPYWAAVKLAEWGYKVI